MQHSQSFISCAVAGALCFAFPSLNATESDASIEASIAKTYVYRTYLKDDAVKTEVVDGVVTLTGQVGEMNHKYMAQEVAAGFPGVVKVENKLEVKIEGTEKSDAWIKSKVRSVLELHRNVSDSNTQVDIKDGVITLRGEATDNIQRDLATAYAEDIKEVVRVINVMTIIASPQKPSSIATEIIDDESIAAMVRTALANHRSTSSIRTKVQVVNGEVSISGIAQNEAERSTVSRLVADLHGVASVNNLMVVNGQ